jgi:hypothetical protein
MLFDPMSRLAARRWIGAGALTMCGAVFAPAAHPQSAQRDSVETLSNSRGFLGLRGFAISGGTMQLGTGKAKSSWTDAQLTLIPRRWPQWEVGLGGVLLIERDEPYAYRDLTSKYLETHHFNVNSSEVIVARRWRSHRVWHWGVRGRVGTITGNTTWCEVIDYGYCGLRTEVGSSSTAVALEGLGELNVFRWMRAEVSLGARHTGKVSAPGFAPRSFSGTTTAFMLRFGKFR